MKTTSKQHGCTLALIAAFALACFAAGYAVRSIVATDSRPLTLEEMQKLEAHRAWIATHGELQSVPPAPAK